MDVYCKKCGEAIDSTELVGHERTWFDQGKGCPSCNWGETCVQCQGSGHQARPYHEPIDCPTCNGERRLVVWCLQGTNDWCTGYLPHVRHISNIQDYRELVRYTPKHSRDGFVYEKLVACPDCQNFAPICPHCNGDGKLHHPDNIIQWGNSILEATDNPDRVLGEMIKGIMRKPRKGRLQQMVDEMTPEERENARALGSGKHFNPEKGIYE